MYDTKAVFSLDSIPNSTVGGLEKLQFSAPNLCHIYG